jgi:hypothetical protein
MAGRISLRGLIAISRDTRIRYKTSELAAMIAHRVAGGGWRIA